MPIEKGLSNLIINKVESKEVYNYMVANNLVNEDEMYLVQGDDEAQIIVDSALNTTSENPVQNKVVATAINNLNTLVGDTPVSDQINTAVASKANASDLTAHTGNNNIHITSTERTNWNAAKAHADSAHAPSNAEENQNAFSNIIVGGTTIAADSKTDTLTIVAGNNVTLTPDATNDKLTITAKDTVYTHPTYTARGAGLYKVTVDGTGHVSEVTNVVKDDIVGLGIPAQDTTYNEATTSDAGLMSASDKTKLNGIADGANKTIVDSTLSSTSTNPVQNKVVNTAISNLNTLVGNTSVASQISNAVANKVDKVDGKGLSTNDYTTNEKNKLSGIATGAEVNQNAFSNVVVGSTTIAADSKTDSLTIIAGNNITITPDAANDKLTIAATDTVYTHPTYTSKSSGLYKITVDGTGHVSATTEVTKSDITALGIPAQDTTYSTATQSDDGLMSSGDKTKLDGIETGANKTTVDSTLSSTSTNPVQNKVVNTAISALNTLVGDTSVATQITSAINDAGFLTVDLNNTESGVAPFTNSDMLGGLPASSYLQVADFPQALTDAGVVKSVVGKTPNASGEVALVPADIGAVPTSRTVNGKALSSDISLTYSDVGAAAASHTHSYLPLEGGTISYSSFGPFFIERTGSTNGASIGFKNGNGLLGYIGMSQGVDSGVYRWTADTSTQYKMYDQGNLSFSLSGTTLTITKS